MPETVIHVKIEGLEELVRSLKDPQLIRGPLAVFLKQSAMHLAGQAKELAPVDTGRYRASIKTEVEETRGIVSSFVHYAPYIEYGTRPHWPPVAAMQPWARRHGFPAGRQGAFLVARAIARRGTRARHVFQRALDGSHDAIGGFFERMKINVEQEWRRRG